MLPLEAQYLNRRFTAIGKKRLGAFLRACRFAHNWSVHQLAAETRCHETLMYQQKGKKIPQSIGVSVSNISRYENGNYKQISFDQLWILLDVLKPLNLETKELMRLDEVLMIGTEELNIEPDDDLEWERYEVCKVNAVLTEGNLR